MMPNDYHLIPSHMRESIIGYIVYGYVPGGFLSAVIANDLVDAAGRADHINGPLLQVYASLLYNVFPRPSQGSRGNLGRWVEGRREEGPFPIDGVSWPETWIGEVEASKVRAAATNAKQQETTDA